MDTIGLVGWNGKSNVGDDAMTAVMINHILNYSQNDCRFQLLADERSLARYTNLDADIHGYDGYNFWQSIPYIRRWLTPRLFDVQLARGSQVLLLGGGSIFHTARHSMRLSRLIQLARQNYPLSVIGSLGISLGPFRSDQERAACKQVLEQLDFVAVRDQRSWDLLQLLDVDVPAVNAMDIALLLPEEIEMDLPDRSQLTATSPAVAVALRQGHTPLRSVSVLAEGLNGLLAKHPSATVELVNFSDVDESVSRALEVLLSDRDRVSFHPYNKRPEVMYQRLARCSLVLASRLHGAVLSYAVETPFAVLAYHQKCVDFAQAVGLDDEWIMPIDELTTPELCERLMSAVVDGHYPKTSVPLESAKQLARKSFELFDEKRLALVDS